MSNTTDDVTGELAVSSPLAPLDASITTGPPPFHPVREWAVIIVGRNPGVFFRSQTLMANVDGIPGSGVIKFYTEAEATAAFSDALEAGCVARTLVQHDRFVVPATEILPGMDLPFLNTTDPVPVVVVFVGRNPGIFTSANRTKKFNSYVLARSELVASLLAGHVIRVRWSVTTQHLTREDFGSSFLKND